MNSVFVVGTYKYILQKDTSDSYVDNDPQMVSSNIIRI